MNEQCGIINLRILIAFKGHLKNFDLEKAFLYVDVNKKVLLLTKLY